MVAAEQTASPGVISTARGTHREGRRAGTRGCPQAEGTRSPRPGCGARGAAPGRGAASGPGHGGSGWDRTQRVSAHAKPSQGLLRSSSSPHPTYSNPGTAFTGRRDSKALGCSELKVNDHLLLSTTQVLISGHATSTEAIFQCPLRLYYRSLQLSFGKGIEKQLHLCTCELTN